MAYGGMRLTPGAPIGQRVSGDSAAKQPSDKATRADPPLHCWVTHPGTDRCPGVLVEWQHDGDQWWGLVVFVADDKGRSVVVTRLVPAAALSPA